MPGKTGADVWERRWAWSGIAFVALVVAWLVVVVATDPAAFDSSDEEIRSFFAPEDGDSSVIILAAVFLGAAALAFLGFLGSLRSLLRRAEGGAGRLAAVAFAAGTVLAGLLLLVNSIHLGIALAVAFEDIEVDPGAYRLVDAIFFGLLMHVGVAATALVGATSIVSLQTGLFPKWLGWAGVAVAVLAFFSWVLFGIPLFLFLLWVLAACIYMLRKAPEPSVDTPAATTR